MKLIKAATLTLALLLSGCGLSNNSKSGDGSANEYNGEKGPNAKQEYYKNYYKKFLLEDRCLDSGMRWYEFAHIFDPVLIDKENKLYVFFSLYMHENGKSVAILETRRLLPPERSVMGGTAYEYVSSDRIDGTWTISDENLVLSGVGSGRAMKYNDHDAIYFTFGKVSAIPELEGKAGFITGASSSSMIEDFEKLDCK